MPSQSRRHTRSGRLVPLFAILTLVALMAGAVLDSVAQQGLQIQANPTSTPTPRVTEEPDIGDIQANPTEEPTRDPIDDIQANPTERPTEEPIDDLQANPTETPDIGEPPIASGTVRVIKRDCPVAIFEGDTFSQWLIACSEDHDGVEFVLNDSNGAEAGVTAGGQVEWTGVDPGVFNITETVPAGYGDPVVFCGYTESPGGGVQHPALVESTGGIVAGTFPLNTNFEYVCYWMNIPAEGGVDGPGSVANPESEGLATLHLMKRTCPNDIPPGQGPAYYIEQCTEVVDGIEFTVTHGNGGSTKPIADGEATWNGIPLGPVTIDEEIPAQYGEPIVFCGMTAIYEGVAYDGFAQLVPSTGGLVEVEVVIPGAYHFCYWFNVEGSPGDFADPGALANTLVTRKWTCPDGTLSNQADRDYYVQNCELLFEPVEFTLTNSDGESTKATSGGFAEWGNVPLGDFTLTEAIPAGYGAPTVFCGWYAYYDGYHYDAFPQLVILAAANVIEGNITTPNTDYFCDVFNIEGEIDDFQANPTEVPAIDDFQGNATAGTVRLVKRSCPLGVVETATLAEYLTLCPQIHDGVEFTLDTSAGAMQDTTAMGEAAWTGVPSGAFAIQEGIPAGYTDPLVFCGYTESPGGGVQHPALQTSTGGLVEGAFPETPFEYVCYWMNIKATGQVGTGPDSVANPGGGGSSVVVVKKRTCPFGTPLDLDMSAYAGQCTGTLDGVTFTVEHPNGSSTKPIVDGEAQWQGLPLGPFTVQEAIPGGYGEPVITCMVIASAADDLWAYVSYVIAQPAANGLIEIDLEIPADLDPPEIAYTHTTCTSYNMPLGPGSVANPTDLSNSLTVRKWVCPGSTQPVEDQDYLESQCALSTVPVEVTLTNADGASTQATDPGWTTWDDVPLGEFTLQETIPDGFAEPIAFCEWTAFYEGNIYDDFSHPVPSAGGLVEGDISVPNTSYACDLFNISTTHTIRAYSHACPEGYEPMAPDAPVANDCDIMAGVPFDLTTDGGVIEDVTDDQGRAEWAYVDLGDSGEIQIRQHTPDGYGEPVVWCVNPPEIAADAQDYEFFQLSATDGTVTAQPEQDFPYTFSCHFFNVPDGAGIGGPDSETNPQDLSNTLVAHKWFCPEGTAADAHLLDYFDLCQLADDPVEFTLTNDDGVSVQETDAGTAQWDDVPLGQFTLKETIPAGSEVLAVWCGWTAFYNGAVYDAFSQPQESQDGLVIGEISVPNTHYRCDFMNVPVTIDDLQANPTEVPEIDDVVANPVSPGTLIVHTWVCPPAYDPLAGSAPDDCAEAHDGVTFDLVNHAEGEPDFQATTGDEIEGAAVFEPQPGTYSLKEQLPDGYGEPFLWNCTGLTNIPDDLEPPLSTINFFRIVIDSGQVIECDWMNVPDGAGFEGPDDVQANPTEVPAIDDVQANPPGSEEPWFRADAHVCPAGFDSNVNWMDLFQGCTIPIEGVEFTFTDASGSSTQALTGSHVQWNQVGIGEGQTVELVETYPAGYTDPFVLCSSWPKEAGDPFDWYYEPVAATGGAISVTPNLDEGDGPLGVIPQGEGYDCKFFHFAVEAVDDFQANPGGTPVDETPVGLPGDEGQTIVPAQVTIVEYVCDPAWDPYAEASWWWWSFLNSCSNPVDKWAFQTFDYTLTDGGGFQESVTNPLHTGANPIAVPVGSVTISSTVPGGFGDPVTMCTGSEYSPFVSPPPPGEAQWGIGDSVIVDFEVGESKLCQFFHMAKEEPTNSVRVNAWSCPVGTAPDQDLASSLATCEEGFDDLEFTLVTWNDGGIQADATVDGVVQFENSALGTLFVEPTLPSWAESLVVFCGIAAAPGAEIQGLAPQELTLSGQARGLLEVPGMEFACHWFFTVAEDQVSPTEGPIDDVQANPTQPPTEEPIDDVTANPVPGTLTIKLAECNPDNTPGTDIYRQDVEYLSVWCADPTTEFEFTVSSEGGFAETATTTGFAASFAEVPVATITIAETVPGGWGEPMTFCWSDQVDSPGWQIGGEVAWSVQAGEHIECLWVNVIGADSHVVTVGTLACPEGVDPADDYWIAIGECDEGVGGVDFTLTTDAGEADAVTDAIGGAVWVAVDLGDSGEIQIAEDVPDGYGEPEVWCVSYPEIEPADPHDLEFVQYDAQDGAITAIPEQHEPYRFGCVFFNIVDDAAGAVAG